MAEVTCEHEDAVRRDGQAGRRIESVQRRSVDLNDSRIATNIGVGEIGVEVTVDHFVPLSTPGKAELIAAGLERLLGQAGHDNDRTADPGQPALEGNNAVRRVDAEDIDAFATQGRLRAA